MKYVGLMVVALLASCNGTDNFRQSSVSNTASKSEGTGSSNSNWQMPHGTAKNLIAGSQGFCQIFDSDRKVKCWGDSQYKAKTVLKSDNLPIKRVRQLDSNGWKYCALTEDGELYCWGHLTPWVQENPWYAPIQINIKGLSELKPDQFSLGYEHACFRKGGRAFCTGKNIYTAFGNPDFEQDKTTNELIPVTVLPKDSQIAKIETSTSNTCALLATGEIYCWGIHAQGQNGNPSSNNILNKAFKVLGFARATQLERARSNPQKDATKYCAMENDKIACWGFLHLKGATEINFGIPSKGETYFASFSPGGEHLCAISKEGIAFCAGNNFTGSLGNFESQSAVLSPVIDAITKKPLYVKEIAATHFVRSSTKGGVSSTCAIDKNDETVCWGSNSVGQLGRTDEEAGCSLIRGGRYNCWSGTDLKLKPNTCEPLFLEAGGCDPVEKIPSLEERTSPYSNGSYFIHYPQLFSPLPANK